jgi:trigger factor
MHQIRIERQADVKDGKLELAKDEEEELRAIAERRVRLGLILSEVGRENNITITDQEMQRAVIMEAQRYPGQEREVFDYYAKNRNALDALRAPVYEDKVVDFILELANVTTKDVTVEELTKAEEDEHYTRKGGKEKKKKA